MVVSDGRIVGVEEYGARREATETVRLDERRGAAARVWSTPTCTATTRAGRTGRGSSTPPGQRPPGGDHARRHAAEQPAADRRRRGAGGEAGGGGGAAASWTSAFWGGAVPANIGGAAAALGRGRAGLQVLPGRLRGRGVPRARRGRAAACGCSRSRRSAGCCWCTPRTPTPSAPAPSGLDYAGFAASRPPEAEVAAIEAVVAASRATGCRVHVVHLAAAAGAARRPRRPGGGRPGHRGDLPALPHADRAPTRPTATRPSSAARPCATTPTATGSGPGCATAPSRMVVSDHSPCPADLKATGPQGLADAWGGISSLQLGLAVTWTEARPTRAHARRRRAAGWPPRPADRAGAAAQGPDRRRRGRPTCACSLPTSPSSSTPPGCTTGTRSRRTPAGP